MRCLQRRMVESRVLLWILKLVLYTFKIISNEVPSWPGSFIFINRWGCGWTIINRRSSLVSSFHFFAFLPWLAETEGRLASFRFEVRWSTNTIARMFINVTKCLNLINYLEFDTTYLERWPVCWSSQDILCRFRLHCSLRVPQAVAHCCWVVVFTK